jgi:predicted O-methyltransferase YrrM
LEHRIVGLLKLIKTAVPGARWADQRLATTLRALAIARVAGHSEAGRKIGMAFNAAPTEMATRIEAGRSALEQDHAILAAGDLGEPGIYDAGKTISEACAASKPPRQAQFLHALARTFAPSKVLELGTNLGVSSAYIASAIPGTLTTLESSPYRLRAARGLHHDLGIDNVRYVQGLFDDTLETAIPEGVEFAFIDGHHQYEPTLRYFDMIAKHAVEGAVFVFDDIRWSTGMKQAWARLCEDNRFGLIVDVRTMGICILGGRPMRSRPIRL